MREIFEKIAVIILMTLSFAVVVHLMVTVLGVEKNHPIKYDCSMVEISPDMPDGVKEECRRKRNVRV